MPDIPIELTALPVPTGVRPATLTELVRLCADYMRGRISATVSFFLQGSNYPTSEQGLFYNQTTQRFGAWNSAQGRYVQITDLQVGDMKPTFVAGDDVSNGWVVLDGRNTNAVSNLTQVQQNNLNTLFGANTAMPNYRFVSGFSNMPANGTFSGIAQGAPTPPAGTIGSLTIGASYSQTEVQALRDNTETLDVSVQNLNTTVAAAKAASEQVLVALNGPSTGGPTWKVYVGV